VFFLISLLFLRQGQVAQQQLPVAQQLKYLPSGAFLKGAALSYDLLLADLLWVKSLAYFGDQYVADHDYSWLYHILDITTTLDPYFEDPYEFGGIVLADEIGDIEKSSLLLKKGMENVSKGHPRYWYLPFFLGFNHWYHKNDFKKGAEYLEQASHFPGSPSYLPMLTARMYADASQAEMALPFLAEMIRSARTPERRAELEQRKKEVIVNRDLDMLDKAVLLYTEHFNEYPDSLDDLVKQGIIKRIPVEPFGGEYLYDLILHTAYSTITERIKMHERKIFN